MIVDTAPTEVQTQAGTATGAVSQIDSNSITIAAASGQGGEDRGGGKDQGNLPAGTYNLSSSAAVVLGGMAGSLSDVHQGDIVRLVVDAQGQVTLIIVKAQAAAVSGTVAMVREDWFALLTANGLVRVDLSDQAQITRNGQAATMQNLQIGDQVQAQGIESEDGLAAQTVTATGSATQSTTTMLTTGSGDN